MEDSRKILSELEQIGGLRELRDIGKDGLYLFHNGRRYLDLSSNDYLGLASDRRLQKEFFSTLETSKGFLMGSSASRLMSGNVPEYTELEEKISELFGGRSALVLASGYAVNTGVLPALTGKDDLILADKLVHASIIDGIRLCGCESHRFRHNDVTHLENLLKKYSGGRNRTWIVTESVFSMDGDIVPLKEIVRLADKYGAKIYLDEAHAFGVYGRSGRGIAEAEGLSDRIDITVATLGKALASTGGFLVCSAEIKKVLVNRMRTLIYSTAIAPINLMWSSFLLERMDSFEKRRLRLKELINAFDGSSPAQIIPVMAGSNERALRMAESLKDEGYWATAIRYPTVPKGAERIRLSLNALMDKEDISRLGKLCRDFG